MSNLVIPDCGWSRDKLADIVREFQHDGETFEQLIKENPKWREINIEVLVKQQNEGQYHQYEEIGVENRNKFDFSTVRAHVKATGLIVGDLATQQGKADYQRYVAPTTSGAFDCTDGQLIDRYERFIERFAQFLQLSYIPKSYCVHIQEAVYYYSDPKTDKTTKIGSKKYFLEHGYSNEDAGFLAASFEQRWIKHIEDMQLKQGRYVATDFTETQLRDIAKELMTSFKQTQFVSKIYKRVQRTLVIKLNSFIGKINDYFRLKPFVTQIPRLSPHAANNSKKVYTFSPSTPKSAVTSPVKNGMKTKIPKLVTEDSPTDRRASIIWVAQESVISPRSPKALTSPKEALEMKKDAY